MKTLLALCILAAFGYAGWTYSRHNQPQTDTRQAEQPRAEQRQAAATTPSPTPVAAAPSPALVVTATPTPRVAPAGTFTKEELLAAINKDAKEPSLEKLLGRPNHKQTTGWTALYTWWGKLDTGNDTPGDFVVEVAPFNNISLVVGIHDPVSRSTAALPWRAKVENDHKYWVQVWFDEQAATAQKKAQLELYKQAARDTQRWAQAQRTSSYVSPLSQPAVRVGPASDDQPQRYGMMTGHGKTRGEAYADAMSQAHDGASHGHINCYMSEGGWTCEIDTTRDR